MAALSSTNVDVLDPFIKLKIFQHGRKVVSSSKIFLKTSYQQQNQRKLEKYFLGEGADFRQNGGHFPVLMLMCLFHFFCLYFPNMAAIWLVQKEMYVFNKIRKIFSGRGSGLQTKWRALYSANVDVLDPFIQLKIAQHGCNMVSSKRNVHF